jgi:predicted HicB family RNase H-like nuclease
MPSKPKKAGRPRLPRGEAKAGTLRVRVTPDELRTIEGKAKATKQTVSEWIRSTLSAALNA